MKLHAWACISISAENNRPRGLLAVRRRTYFFFFLFFLFSQIDIKSNISSLPCFDSLRELLSIINVKTIRIYISIYFCFPFREVVRVISERSKTNDFVVPCKSCPSTDRVNGSILSILRDLIFLLFFFFFLRAREKKFVARVCCNSNARKRISSMIVEIIYHRPLKN